MEERIYNAKGIISGFRRGAGYEKIQDFANELGITRATYEKYERDPSTMTLGTLQKMEELLGEEFREFFWKHRLYKK